MEKVVIISERRLKKIESMVIKMEWLEAIEKDKKRVDDYQEISRLAWQEISDSGNGLAARCLVECKDCSSWCKMNGKVSIMWPMARMRTICPFCKKGLLVWAGVV